MSAVDSPLTCPRHPNVTTYLRCSACNVLICPDCMIPTPVGQKCLNCGTVGRDANAEVATSFTPAEPSEPAPPDTAGLTFNDIIGGAFTGMLLGFPAGIILHISIGMLLFALLAYGFFVGEAIYRSVGQKSGRHVETIAGVSYLIGAVLGQYSVALFFPHSALAAFGIWAGFAGFLVDPIAGIWNAIIAGTAVVYIRHKGQAK